MVFLEPHPTSFDLRFRLFGTPVRVNPTFWLMGAVFGWGFSGGQLSYLLLFLVCFFLSILIHEFGHVTAGRIFGRPGHIVLYSFGGLAIGSYEAEQRWQRIIISFSGPGAGFLLLGLVYLLQHFVYPQIPLSFRTNYPIFTRVSYYTINILIWMNLFWGVFNLVPIWPLDGGMMSREICCGLSPYNGVKVSLGISILAAGGGAVYSLLAWKNPNLPYPPQFSHVFIAIFFGLMAMESFQLMQQANRGPWDQ